MILNYVFALFFIKMFSFVCIKLFEYVHLCSSKMICGTSFKMLILPVSTVFVYYVIAEADFLRQFPVRIRWLSLVSCIILAVSNIIMFYQIEKHADLERRNKENELYRLKSVVENKYCSHLEEINYHNLIYRHNLKHCFAAISELAAEGKKDEITQMLKQMELGLETTTQKQYTRNNILNALLCEKAAEAERRNISFSLEIEPDVELSSIKDIDLVAMFGNLIDNAIEAAEQIENDPERKNVKLFLFNSDGYFTTCIIQNHFKTVPVKIKDYFLTTKKNEHEHGLGIESVKTTAALYGGMLYTKTEKDIFTATLSIPADLKK